MQKRFGEASAVLEQAVKNNPKVMLYYKNLAKVLAQDGKLGEAKKILKSGIDAKVQGYVELSDLLKLISAGKQGKTSDSKKSSVKKQATDN